MVLLSTNLPKEPECPPMEVPTKAIVFKVTPANQVLPVVLPTETSGGSHHGPRKGWILEELYLQDLEEWPDAERNGLVSSYSNGNTHLPAATWTWAKHP